MLMFLIPTVVVFLSFIFSESYNFGSETIYGYPAKACEKY